MTDIDSDYNAPYAPPQHLGSLIRNYMDHVDWNVTQTAAELGCDRVTLSRVLNGHIGVSPQMALALERLNWGTAEQWTRMQADYELVQAGRDRVHRGQIGHHVQEAIRFYESSYDWLGGSFLSPGQRATLGDRENRVCRFCGLSEPNASFRTKAHAIPEFLGNKSLLTNYECDSCNQHFGIGIENDLASWTKPSRTLSRIRGKRGVPTIKELGAGKGWRIEYDSAFRVTQYEADPIAEIDEEQKRVTFTLKRDPYTPVAVLKAFVKIGLTVIPESELGKFRDTIKWIRCRDHSRPFVQSFPILHTFQPGPMRNDLTVLMLMRRKPDVSEAPFAFFVIGFGNDVFQVFLPCPEEDRKIHAQPLHLPPFPTPAGAFPTPYGRSRTTKVDLCGRERVTDDFYHARFGFEHVEITRHEEE